LREREALQTEVEQSHQLLREVIDQVPAFVTAVAEDGSIILWNKQLEAVTGFSAREMLTRDGSLFRDGDEVQRLTLRGGGHRAVRWRRARVDSGQPGTQVTYALGEDVSDELEEERRTRMAERLAAAGMLAAGLAHEVRNPLNSATLQLQLLGRRLRRGTLDVDATSATLEAIQSEIDRLSRLVDDFLAFAKPQPLDIEASDPVQLISDVVGTLQEAANARGATLSTETTDVGLVPIDVRRLRQVLTNLITNSLESFGPTGGTVIIRAQPAAHAASVVIEVEDNGPGFSAEAPVFDAFYTTKDAGTGLGLAIVHRVVTEHGESIRVTSTPGRTTFRLELPQPASQGRARPD
jgi:signal transduction histidine kinase